MRSNGVLVTVLSSVLLFGAGACETSGGDAPKTIAGTASTSAALSVCSADATLTDAVAASAPIAVSRQPGASDLFYVGAAKGTVARRTLLADRMTFGAEEDAA